MTLGPQIGVDYHVNYRGPNYLTDVWYLCGAFDNLAEARTALETRIAADLGRNASIGSEWRLVAVHQAEVVAVIEHACLTDAGLESVAPKAGGAQGGADAP